MFVTVVTYAELRPWRGLGVRDDPAGVGIEMSGEFVNRNGDERHQRVTTSNFRLAGRDRNQNGKKRED